MITPEEVLEFWLDEVGEKGWYAVDDALDQTIRDRFEDAWHDARDGKFDLWLIHPAGMLAYIILMDQFPRNMFRGDARAFATDLQALAAAKSAIERRWDLRIEEPARQFFYLPMMHSESLYDQHRCVRLIVERMPRSGADNLLHAQAHREVIRTFGRFPYRNKALGRASSPSETEFLNNGGYGETLRMLQQRQAA